MTDEELTALGEACAGFHGHFEYQPARNESRSAYGGGDWVEHAPRLAYVPATADDEDYDAHFTIMEQAEQHVAEPIALMLNAVPRLLAELKKRP